MLKWVLIGGLSLGAVLLLMRRARAEPSVPEKVGTATMLGPSTYCKDPEPSPKTGGRWECHSGLWKFNKEGSRTLTTAVLVPKIT